MRLSKIYAIVEKWIGDLFARYGRFVARHPVKIIILAFVINGGLAVGMVKLKQIKNIDVYIPTGVQAQAHQARMEDLFPEYSGNNITGFQFTSIGLWTHVVVKSKTGNLLSRTVLEDVKRLDTYVRSTTATSKDGTPIHYSDICASFYGQCYIEGDLFFSAEFLAAVDSNLVTYPEFTRPMFGSENYESWVGGRIKLDSSLAYLQSAEYVLLMYRLNYDTADMATLWMDKFITSMEKFSSDYFEIAYAHSSSLGEELDKNIIGDISLFAVTLGLMITYACIASASARCDNVGQRMMLGFAGVLAAVLAIVASFGLCSAMGVAFVSIVGAAPFLVIGIGIDDMFILLSGLSGAQDRLTVEDRIGETLRTSGVGITITSLTDFLAFMTGAISNFLAVKNFCIYTGVAVLFCYFNFVTLFTACMAINEKRVNDNRHFLTCLKTKSNEELKEEGKSRKYMFCCGGKPPTSREESESYLDKLPRWLFPKIVLRTPLKITILVIFAGYLAAAIYGCARLKQGLEFKQSVAEDSYYYKYATWTQDYFKRVTPVSFVIDSSNTYSDPTVQTNLEALLKSAKADEYFNSEFELSWLASFKNSPYYDRSSETNFISALKAFLSDPIYRIFEKDVIIDTVSNKIVASRVHVKSDDMADSQAEGRLMERARDIASAASINCFSYSFLFIYYEQYVAVLPQSIQSVGIALVAIFVVTCLFMPHPVLIFYVTVAVFMIMIGVFGFLFYVDVALSAITMINLIMSIGFSVDFAAHICHGFMTANGETRHDCVRQAIDTTGAPIFHGFVSSCIGILVLAFAKSYIFVTFAKVMALVLVFCITHALLLLTVILSWFGPAEHNLVRDSPKGKPDTQESADKLNSIESNTNALVANGFVTKMKYGDNDRASPPYLIVADGNKRRFINGVTNSKRNKEVKHDIYIAGTGLLDSSMGGLNFI